MTDPLDALRSPAASAVPDPGFAAALRSRLERALLDRTEHPVTTAIGTSTRVRTSALTPYLAVVDARAAVDFYVTAFGAVRRGEPIVMDDGRVGHVEIALGDSVLMLADEFPEMGLVAPVTRGGVSQSLRLEVTDPDTVVTRAVAAGATLDRPVSDSPYGRGGAVLDPSGHRWMVAREAPTARPGDIVHASLWTPDAERARTFFGAVLGDLERLGMSTGPSAGLFCGYAVDDVDAAVAVVRAAGGTAGEPVDDHGGRVADCVDDQGLAFALFQGPGAPVTVPEYAELRLPDATRARAFYGTVLGWGFTPGDHGTDYWNPTVDGGRTCPSTGLHGGHDVPTVVPTFAVPDLAEATAAARAAGGTIEEPIGSRFGLVARCTDDQGTPFVLLQH